MFTQASATRVKRDRRLQGRRMVLVDVENLNGGVVKTIDESRTARLRLGEAIELRADDLVVIGTCHMGLLNAGLGWPGARPVCRSGPNGADLALLEVIGTERIAERFCEVVLASGDGIFAEAVAALAGAGVNVTVVSRREACSRRLRMAACRTVFLDEQMVGIGGAA